MRTMYSWFCLLMLSLLPFTAQAATEEDLPSVEEVRAVVFGDWQVLSFQRKGGELIDYSKENIIWSFGENYRASIQGAGFTPFMGGYKVIPSRWGWAGITGVFIVVKGLDQNMENYSRHPKLIAKHLSSDGVMRIVNWENDLTFMLRKVQ